MNLFSEIGETKLRAIITEFYNRAFTDPIISHFFFKHDHTHLIEQQFAFTATMLGATHISYTGKGIKEAHEQLPIWRAHFLRRQVILAEVMDFYQLDKKVKDKWLSLEKRLEKLVTSKSQ